MTSNIVPRMRYLIFFLLLGSAVGQTSDWNGGGPNGAGVAEHPAKHKSRELSYIFMLDKDGKPEGSFPPELGCDSMIDFVVVAKKPGMDSPHPKRIRDIFPSECPAVTVPAPKGEINILTPADVIAQLFYPNPCGSTPAPDVPAIHKSADSDWRMTGSETIECSNNGHPDWIFNSDKSLMGLEHRCVDGWTWECADKSRILMMAEDGKAWCHKPQTY